MSALKCGSIGSVAVLGSILPHRPILPHSYTPMDVDLVIYPDLCDSFGHLNQASYLTLFERARWEVMARGPGMDFFQKAGVWPAVRKAGIDYLAQVFPGDTLRFGHTLTHLGRTSLTLRQTARRVSDDQLVATAEFTFVCLGTDGRPVPVPRPFSDLFASPTVGGEARRITVHGVNLAVDQAGEGQALLLIHGYPLNRSLWRHQLGAFPGWRTIAPDLRGMGESDAPDLGYSMATYAEDLVSLLDSMGVDEAVICGLSMGGYIAMEILRRHRQRVRGLVLMDTRLEADSSEGRKARDAAAQAARDKGAAAIAEAMLPKLFASPDAEHVGQAWDDVRQMILTTPVPGIVGALSAMRDRLDSTGLLPTLDDLPALVVVGEDDRITPYAAARAMAELLPMGRLEAIGGAGHLAPLERPDEVTRALADFLGSISPASAAPAGRQS